MAIWSLLWWVWVAGMLLVMVGLKVLMFYLANLFKELLVIVCFDFGVFFLTWCLYHLFNNGVLDPAYWTLAVPWIVIWVIPAGFSLLLAVQAAEPLENDGSGTSGGGLNIRFPSRRR